MKIFFVQLSDMHCHAKDHQFTTRIDKAVAAIKTLGKTNHVVLIFTGDLTDTAEINEFRAGKHLLGTLLAKLNKELDCGFINTIIVPGNHDMILPENSRCASDIIEWNKDEHLSDELDKLKNFFDYSRSKNCFNADKICCIKNITLDNTLIQFCLLNSAPFSTREPEDKQLHYLPVYVSEKLARNKDADLKITVMHHHYEWCDWQTKELVKKSIDQDDIVFFGHDHKAESITMANGDGSIYNIIMGGQFNISPSKDSSFNVVIFDSEKSMLERYEFNWNHNLFTPTYRGQIKKKNMGLTPTQTYLNRLLADRLKIGTLFTDYYVFPKLVLEGEGFSTENNWDCVTINDIFNAVKSHKVIRLTGNSDSGKSSLLRFLYKKSIDLGYIPLFIEKRDYRDSKIDKMLQVLFDEQYETIFDAYEQTEASRKIVFIDDIDLIHNSNARGKLITSILESGKLLIYTTKEKNLDLEESVKEKLQGKTISTINIAPFYKETRDELVTQVCTLRNKNVDETATIITALDYMVQCQTCFFSFTPGNLLQYIKYFLQSGVNDHKGVETISMVFETNIRNSILACVKDSVANVYLMALEYLADEIYFKIKREYIEISKFESVVDDYNNKRKAKINAKAFLKSCIDAHILKENEDVFSICFYDNNTFAYFVAKSINREFEKNQMNTSKLTFVMNHICFGINDTIILFLSFIRSNTNITLRISEEASEIMQEYPEWCFAEQNIPFLHQSDMQDKLPSSEEKKDNKKQVENIEKNRHELIKFRGIFDYDEEDANKERYKVLRALKYSQLIGRALIDQYGALDADEIEHIVHELYSVPQKIIFAILKPYQDHSNEIVHNIFEFAKINMPEEKISEDYVRKILGEAGTVLALNIMNDIAYNASNENTIVALRDEPLNNSNFKIMQLMMEENVGNSPEFVSKAILLRKQLENDPYAIMLIAQIARKHIIYTENLDYRQIDKLLSGKVISPESKKTLLIEQSKNSKS